MLNLPCRSQGIRAFTRPGVWFCPKRLGPWSDLKTTASRPVAPVSGLIERCCLHRAFLRRGASVSRGKLQRQRHDLRDE